MYAAWPATSPGIAPERLRWLGEPVDVALDLGHRRDRVLALGAVLPACLRCRGQRALVDRVRSGVRDPERAVVDDHLGVAVVGLELQTELVLGQPEPAAGAAQDRIDVALEVRGVDQVVGEADPAGDPLHRLRGQRAHEQPAPATSRFGTGPDPAAATAIAVPAAIATTTPPIVASSRRVEAVRRNLVIKKPFSLDESKIGHKLEITLTDGWRGAGRWRPGAMAVDSRPAVARRSLDWRRLGKRRREEGRVRAVAGRQSPWFGLLPRFGPDLWRECHGKAA